MVNTIDHQPSWHGQEQVMQHAQLFAMDQFDTSMSPIETLAMPYAYRSNE